MHGTVVANVFDEPNHECQLPFGTRVRLIRRKEGDGSPYPLIVSFELGPQPHLTGKKHLTAGINRRFQLKDDEVQWDTEEMVT